ncbi:MAG: hypothetical protein KC731_24855 [Myxococcales bacterium]|nr:hypothetical protein [Myxococcales bacterium]
MRLIRSRKDVDWSRYLEPGDFDYLDGTIEDGAWYPTSTYERYGLAILHQVALGSVAMVRTWGRFQVDAMLRVQPGLIAHDDPRESLMRVVVHRKGFFDYDVLTVLGVLDDHARFQLSYRMCDVAELAACAQTTGALEEITRRAGGMDVKAGFMERTWEGDSRTVLEIRWS